MNKHAVYKDSNEHTVYGNKKQLPVVPVLYRHNAVGRHEEQNCLCWSIHACWGRSAWNIVF